MEKVKTRNKELKLPQVLESLIFEVIFLWLFMFLKIGLNILKDFRIKILKNKIIFIKKLFL